jgi:hypothetical protein
MNNQYYKKYIKYKNKYIELYNKIGGAKISSSLLTEIEKDNYKLSDYYDIIDMHGDIDSKSLITIPNNLIIIIANCCGAPNYDSLIKWFTGLEEDYIRNKMKNDNYSISSISSYISFKKEDLLNQIQKITENNAYIILEPGTFMCNMNLNNEYIDALGGHKKIQLEYNRHKIIYNEIYDLLNNQEKLQDKITKIINNYNIVNNYNISYFKLLHTMLRNNKYFKEWIKYILNKHNIQEAQLNQENNILLKEIITGIKDIEEFKPDSSDFNFHIEEINKDTLYFHLLFLFFLIFIKDMSTITLDQKLEEISNNVEPNKYRVVYINSCQEKSNEKCNVNKCYRLIHGITGPMSKEILCIEKKIKQYWKDTNESILDNFKIKKYIISQISKETDEPYYLAEFVKPFWEKIKETFPEFENKINFTNNKIIDNETIKNIIIMLNLSYDFLKKYTKKIDFIKFIKHLKIKPINPQYNDLFFKNTDNNKYLLITLSSNPKYLTHFMKYLKLFKNTIFGNYDFNHLENICKFINYQNNLSNELKFKITTLHNEIKKQKITDFTSILYNNYQLDILIPKLFNISPIEFIKNNNNHITNEIFNRNNEFNILIFNNNGYYYKLPTKLDDDIIKLYIKHCVLTYKLIHLIN